MNFFLLILKDAEKKKNLKIEQPVFGRMGNIMFLKQKVTIHDYRTVVCEVLKKPCASNSI